MKKRKGETVQAILSNEAVGFGWAFLYAYVIIMACFGVWYRFEVITKALGL